MKYVCPKCHRKVKKRNFDRHKKDCVPTEKDIKRFLTTKSGGGEKK